MLNERMNSLWAKKTKGDQDEKWLPLVVHMWDAAEIAKLLWRDWLPSGTKRTIARGFYGSQGNNDDDYDAVLACFLFLVAVHDIGKAILAFQGNLSRMELDELLRKQLRAAGLPLRDIIHPHIARHYWASQLILQKNGFHTKLAVIIGGHHGQPPSGVDLQKLKTYANDLGWGQGQEAWGEVQRELLAYALKLAGISEQEAQSWQPDITAQVLLSGLVIMVDWIVSNQVLFPYIDLTGRAQASAERADIAWKNLELPEYWSPNNAWMRPGFYAHRFEIEPRPIQSAVLQLLGEVSHPGIVIIEAPMGEGKTEAALAAAELMAYQTKRSGVFFALPTQASANGLFLRFCNWIESLDDGFKHSVKLAHGKADLNELYNKIPETKITEAPDRFWVGGEESEGTYDDVIIVHDWLSGRKKGILADFVIGTIDQVLMGSLKQKHLALRHLGLANKVVILDECHAYDAYMSEYLYKVLNWLGAYDVPVVILSATLPGEKRHQMIKAYLNEEHSSVPEYDPVFDKQMPEVLPLPLWATTLSYPIITYTAGSNIENVRQQEVLGKQRSLKVKINILSTIEEIASKLDDLLSEGGCAGIIVNTVKRAQELAYALSQHFGEEQVHLVHARFLAVDRAQKEKELFARLGVDGERPQRCIVVGTQIFEQSCDLDFDVLITDICPMDLLIQRIGRLHRHPRYRLSKLQQPQCFIIGISDSGFERGTELIYGKYLLMNTQKLLPAHLNLPHDIPRLVQATYCAEGLPMPSALQKEYNEAKTKHEERIDQKKSKSHGFQIADPYKRFDDLVGWLDIKIEDDPSGKRAEASVRDTADSLEVLVVQRRDNAHYMLPWLAKFPGRKIPADAPPDAELARAMAECSLQLPRELCWDLDKTIKELETIALRELRAWQQADRLKGELFLVLDEQFGTELCGYYLQYDRRYGMLVKKNEEGDVNGR